ncbi:hypothetical protein LINPERHAP1_LOCUS13914, partial [Linum perenne]
MDFSMSDDASIVPEETNDSDSPPMKKSKSTRRTSPVWKDFELFNAIDEEGNMKEKAKCRTC